jgi:hypothetical protein
MANWSKTGTCSERDGTRRGAARQGGHARRAVICGTTRYEKRREGRDAGRGVARRYRAAGAGFGRPHDGSYVQTYMRAYIHACIRTCIHAYMHTCIHAYIHASMCTDNRQTDRQTDMHAWMQPWMLHPCIHTCIHAYRQTCSHTYRYTYMRDNGVRQALVAASLTAPEAAYDEVLKAAIHNDDKVLSS